VTFRARRLPHRRRPSSNAVQPSASVPPPFRLSGRQTQTETSHALSIFVVRRRRVRPRGPAAAQTATPQQAAAEPPLAIAPAGAGLQWGACPPIFPTGCEIALLHGNPAQPNADIFLRVAPGTTLAPHRHTSAERMILVSGTLEVDYRGAPPATLNAGDYAYGPAGRPHRATCRSAAPCTLFIAFEGPVDALPHEGPLD